MEKRINWQAVIGELMLEGKQHGRTFATYNGEAGKDSIIRYKQIEAFIGWCKRNRPELQARRSHAMGYGRYAVISIPKAQIELFGQVYQPELERDGTAYAVKDRITGENITAVCRLAGLRYWKDIEAACY